VTRIAVAAAADRELDTGVARDGHDARYVGVIGDLHDRRRPAGEPREEHGARFVVSGILGRDHRTAEVGTQLRDREIRRGLGRGRHGASSLGVSA
jgi:hypothetical protein